MSCDQTHIEVLTESDCWLLLRTVQLGRLAVSTAAGVDIFPINFVVDRGTVVFRTAAGTKLSAALSDQPVAFEADGKEGETNRCWSVVLHGKASEVRYLDETLDAMRLPLTPAAGTSKPRFLRISPHTVTGRRFADADPAFWSTPITRTSRAPIE